MKHWQYLIWQVTGATIEMREEALSKFGADGWELIAIVDHLGYFKREVIRKGEANE